MEMNILTIRNADKLYQEVTEALGPDIVVKECFFTFKFSDYHNSCKIEGKFIFEKRQDVYTIIDTKLKKFKNRDCPKLLKISYVKVSKSYKYD